MRAFFKEYSHSPQKLSGKVISIPKNKTYFQIFDEINQHYWKYELCRVIDIQEDWIQNQLYAQSLFDIGKNDFLILTEKPVSTKVFEKLVNSPKNVIVVQPKSQKKQSFESIVVSDFKFWEMEKAFDFLVNLWKISSLKEEWKAEFISNAESEISAYFSALKKIRMLNIDSLNSNPLVIEGHNFFRWIDDFAGTERSVWRKQICSRLKSPKEKERWAYFFYQFLIKAMDPSYAVKNKKKSKFDQKIINVANSNSPKILLNEMNWWANWSKRSGPVLDFEREFK